MVQELRPDPATADLIRQTFSAGNASEKVRAIHV
jgi:hypothetical protein